MPEQKKELEKLVTATKRILKTDLAAMKEKKGREATPKEEGSS